MATDDKHRKKADALFGQIALRLGILTKQQLQEALELQRFAKGHKPLGVLLMETRMVTEQDLERIVKAQKDLLEAANSRQKAVKEDNLFGKVAIRLGFCAEEQLVECLALQEQLPRERFMRLGDIMVIKGYLSVEQVKKISDTQKGLIVYCPQCDTQYNVVMFRPGASIQCYRCGSPLRIPTRATSPQVDEALYFGEE
jgi:ribosomal protein S27E